MTAPDMTVALLERAEGESLYAWADALRDIRPAMAEVGYVFLENAQANIAERRDPWGGAWADVTAMTAAIAQRRGRATGGRSFLPKIKVELVGTNRVRIAIESRASRTFHFGQTSVRVFGRTTSKNVPPRPLLPIRGGNVDVPEELMTTVREALRDALRHALRNRRQG
jgi:hypothetical protein